MSLDYQGTGDGGRPRKYKDRTGRGKKFKREHLDACLKQDNWSDPCTCQDIIEFRSDIFDIQEMNDG